jgi:hypothetical protein
LRGAETLARRNVESRFVSGRALIWIRGEIKLIADKAARHPIAHKRERRGLQNKISNKESPTDLWRKRTAKVLSGALLSLAFGSVTITAFA